MSEDYDNVDGLEDIYFIEGLADDYNAQKILTMMTTNLQ